MLLRVVRAAILPQRSPDDAGTWRTGGGSDLSRHQDIPVVPRVTRDEGRDTLDVVGHREQVEGPQAGEPVAGVRGERRGRARARRGRRPRRRRPAAAAPARARRPAAGARAGRVEDHEVHAAASRAPAPRGRPDGRARRRPAPVEPHLRQVVQVAAGVRHGAGLALDAEHRPVRADPVGQPDGEQPDPGSTGRARAPPAAGERRRSTASSSACAAPGCTCQKPAPDDPERPGAAVDLHLLATQPRPRSRSTPCGPRTATDAGRGQRRQAARRGRPRVDHDEPLDLRSAPAATTSTARTPGQRCAATPTASHLGVGDRAGVDRHDVVRAVPPQPGRPCVVDGEAHPGAPAQAVVVPGHRLDVEVRHAPSRAEPAQLLADDVRLEPALGLRRRRAASRSRRSRPGRRPGSGGATRSGEALEDLDGVRRARTGARRRPR